MEELCQVKQQDAATIKCPICSLTSHDVHALELSQGIALAAATAVDGPEEVDDGDEDGRSTDLEALTERVPAPEAVPPPEAVPQPETAPAQVIIITTIVYVPTRVHDYY